MPIVSEIPHNGVSSLPKSMSSETTTLKSATLRVFIPQKSRFSVFLEASD